MATTLQELVERVRAARDGGTPLRVRAGGTKDFYGNLPRGEVLDPRPWQGIESYEPSELVVTVRSGTPLAELEAVLAAQGQMLAFEPPHFGQTGAPSLSAQRIALKASKAWSSDIRMTFANERVRAAAERRKC